MKLVRGRQNCLVFSLRISDCTAMLSVDRHHVHCTSHQHSDIEPATNIAPLYQMSILQHCNSCLPTLQTCTSCKHCFYFLLFILSTCIVNIFLSFCFSTFFFFFFERFKLFGFFLLVGPLNNILYVCTVY